MKKPLRIIIVLFFIFVAGSTIQAQCIESFVIDSIADGNFHYNIAVAGDVNNDGYDDFLITNSYSSTWNNNVYGFFHLLLH